VLALSECKEALERLFLCEDEDRGDGWRLSAEEAAHAQVLVETCQDILALVSDQTGVPMEELENRDIARAISDAQDAAHHADTAEEGTT
jgi:hypothetical protein